MDRHDVSVKHVNIPIPSNLHEKLTEMASTQGRSVRKQILWMLKRQIDQEDMNQEKR